MISASRDGATVPDQITVPADVLARHGVRLLDPTSAVRDSDGEYPLSTAYRPDTLLVSKRELNTLVPGNDYDRALAELGLALRKPDDPEWNSIIEGVDDRLGVPAQLVRTESRDADRPPDAWTALVALRKWFGDRQNLVSTGRADAPPMGLDHLLMAANATHGVPYSGGGSVSGGTPYSGGGSVSGMGGIALHTGDRNPVQVLMDPPHRRALGELPGGRRPVIAVVDTGIGRHPWLPTTGDSAADQVIETSQRFQDWIAAHERNLIATTGAAIVPVATPWEVRDEVQPLLGLTDSHAGHGTFVSGLVFQNCPDAKILSLRLLHSDGFSTEGSILLALEYLRKRVLDSEKDPNLWIDVVSLSLGFYPETTTPAKVTLVKEAIDRLTELGVVVVAAAGNDATLRPFLPAAHGQDNGLVAAVGALNASGDTIAAFSNAGSWITRWAPGNALVSTVPIWQGARGPNIAPELNALIEPITRTSPDDDDLKTGFAMWAGTSFATPVVAGKIGQVILDNPNLLKMDPQDRAKQLLGMTNQVLDKLGWPVREPIATK
jgi:hypothetical protein